jgi:hypothetical protein
VVCISVSKPMSDDMSLLGIEILFLILRLGEMKLAEVGSLSGMHIEFRSYA